MASYLLALMLFATPAPFHGHVADPTGGAIVNAHVIAVPEGPGPAPAAVTDERGDFEIALAPGRYILSVTADGFREVRQRLVVDAGGATAALDVVLRIAGVTESVTVSGISAGASMSIVSATRTPTPLRDVPQAVTVVSQQLIGEQLMTSMADVVRYVPGVTAHQGENNRDQLVIRGNSTSADFFVNGVRDDVQYYRDLYNLERVEALKGPNAMMFGRGGAGGVINRVTRQAGFGPVREVTLQGGAFGTRRLTGDVGQAVSGSAALRMAAMFEDSGSFRNGVNLRRYGVTPSATFVPGTRTLVTVRYEYLHDGRVADRGIPSFQGRPADVDVSTYYGDPAQSRVSADVHLSSATIEHHVGGVTVRNQTLVGRYDRGYQNFVPGAVTPDQSRVALTAYNNATDRTNLFNQTDVTSLVSTGSVRHTLLAGAEVGRQLTDNFRNTGYFNNTATTIVVPYSSPTIDTPVAFRQSATDADNHLRTSVGAVFAQDQMELSPAVQVVAGLRFDRFGLQYHNNRNGDTLSRPDNLLSPRAGVVFKPMVPLSIYGSYSVSYLPSSGDQFSSLTAITEQMKPEKFNNYEAGVKWDVRPRFSLTTAAYRLDRTNTRSTDPNDPTRIVQTGSQRTSGYEAGVNGQVTALWRMTGGYTWQDARVTSATAAAPVGAQVAQVPHQTFSLWNRVQAHPRVAAALGLSYRSDMFAAIDNTVVLPGYARADAAAFVSVTRRLQLQANVDNVLDVRYYANADSNTNISPGQPRTLRIALTATF